jgi:nitrite reductase (NADH) large subunit
MSEQSTARHSSDKERIIIVGNGMVGHRLIEVLSGMDAAKDIEIVTFAEESRLAYDRVQLSSFFSGSTAEDLALTDECYYEEKGVTFLLDNKVTDIDRSAKTILTSAGKTERYDKLVIATGSYPFVPPIPGNDQQHCHVYRTIDDLEAITESANSSEIGVVVGGGLLGLEAANALKNLNLETHIVEFAPRLMAVQLDDGGANQLRRKIESTGLTVHTEKNTQKIVAGETRRYRMVFSDDSFIETDLIVFSAGIRPQDELATLCGLETGERGGIIIDDQCRTSDADIFAIGECALWENRIFGLVGPGYEMAKVAAAQITGGDRTFHGADMSTKLKLLGVDVASIGDAHGTTKGSQSYYYQDDINGTYKRLIVSGNGKKLLGVVLIGEVDAYGSLLQLMLNGIKLPTHPESLILPTSDPASVSIGVESLPGAAQICSCYDVTKGQICSAVEAGCTTLGDIKSTLHASTGCGGCAALVKEVIDCKLQSMGVETNNNICEHFSYSRQEAADIIRVSKIKTFKDFLERHGTGLGCEICKPTVGSILASYWNEHILEQQHLGLQDTNDIFMANMQKNGTYSVVPRIPGGEITPDKLIAIGEVAKEFDLYTKITGGQRIDLFGAHVHELPLIWEKLIDAGFETGHAYGKALRTVKSCVGSSWCRFGVQDSVGEAIRIEQRYRGLRSPHKIKMAVSGCTRECAEAQSKDVGIIATEKGWNLYVCGNGGMRPRHADLFATDLSTKTLITYIDRFLMFYVRTADRLQRTSVWLEKLEGGLDYLREVIIEDKLGICAELEKEMEAVVESYVCEWKATINDPEKLKRFNHFVNADDKDSNIVFVSERGQKRPANIENEIRLVEVGK